MANGIQIPVGVDNQTESGLNTIFSKFRSFNDQIQKYAEIKLQVNSGAFDRVFNDFKSQLDGARKEFEKVSFEVKTPAGKGKFQKTQITADKIAGFFNSDASVAAALKDMEKWKVEGKENIAIFNNLRAALDTVRSSWTAVNRPAMAHSLQIAKIGDALDKQMLGKMEKYQSLTEKIEAAYRRLDMHRVSNNAAGIKEEAKAISDLLKRRADLLGNKNGADDMSLSRQFKAESDAAKKELGVRSQVEKKLKAINSLEQERTTLSKDGYYQMLRHQTIARHLVGLYAELGALQNVDYSKKIAANNGLLQEATSMLNNRKGGLQISKGIVNKDLSEAIKRINPLLGNKSGIDEVLKEKVSVKGWKKAVDSYRDISSKLGDSMKFGNSTYNISSIEGVTAALDKMGEAAKKQGKNVDQALQAQINDLTKLRNAYIDVANGYQAYQDKLATQRKKAAKSETSGYTQEQFDKRVFYDQVKNRKQAEKDAIRKDKLNFINKSITESTVALSGTKDLRERVQLMRDLNGLLNTRYQMTKNIRDLESARMYTQQARETNKELKAQEAIHKQIAAAEARKRREIERTNKAMSFQKSVMGTLKSLMSRYVSIFTIGRFIQNVASATGYFQQQQVALEGILGSATKASEVLGQIKSFALKSPFQTKELVGFTKQLSAFGVNSDDLFPTVTKLADVSAGLGVDMSRIILAYGQVKSASVLRGQELRQFTEAGIPMVEALAKKLSDVNGRLVTTADVFDYISKRKVPFEMVASVLSDMSAEGGKFYKMQENITDTMYGQMQKLKDVATIAMDKLGNSTSSIIMPVIKGLQTILANVKSFGAALVAALSVSKVMMWVKAIDVGIHRLSNMQKGLIGIRRVMAVIRASSSAMFGAIGLAVGVAVGVFAKLYERLREVDRAMKEVEKASAKDLQKTISGFDTLTGKLERFTKGTKEYEEALSTLMQNYSEFGNVKYLASLIEQNKALGEQKKTWEDLANAIKAAIKARNDYDMHVSMMEKAKGMAEEQGVGGEMWRLKKLGNFETQYIDIEGGMQSVLGGMTPREAFENIAENARTSFLNQEKASDMTQENYEKIFKEQLKLSFPKFDQEKFNKTVSKNIEISWNAINTEALRKVISEKETIENTPYAKVQRLFNSVTPRSLVYSHEGDKDYDPFDLQFQTEIAYLKKLGVGFNQLEVQKLGKDDLTEDATVEDYKTKYRELAASLRKAQNSADSSELTVNISELNDRFDDTIKLLSSKGPLYESLNLLRKSFFERVTTYTDKASVGVKKNIESTFKSNRWSDEQKTYASRFNVGVGGKGLDAQRSALLSAFEENQKEQKSYADKDSAEYSEIIKRLRDEEAVMRQLASKNHLNVDLTSKRGGAGGGKGDWQAYANLFFDRIKEARQLELNAYTSGLGRTDQFKEWVDTLDDSNPLKGFYTGKNPFEDILGRISEYNLEGVFNAEDFKSIEAMMKDGFADYEALWAKLIDIVSKSAEKESDKTRKSIIRAFDLRKLEEGDKIFGGDKVDQMIQKTLYDMTKIRTIDELKKARNEKFSSLIEGDASNFSDLYQKLLGGSNVPINFRKSASTAGMLREMLKVGGNEGFANSQVGQDMAALLSGAIGFDQLDKIYNVIEALKNMGKTEDMKDEFTKVLPLFQQGMEELVSAISDEYTKAQAMTRTDMMKESDKTLNIFYKTLLQPFEELKQLPDEIDGKSLDKVKRTVDILRNAYLALTSSLGVQAQASWTRLYKDETGQSVTGLNKEGQRLNNLFGNADLATRILAPEIAKFLEDYNVTDINRFVNDNGEFDWVKFQDEIGDKADELIERVNEVKDKIEKTKDVVATIQKYTALFKTLTDGIFSIVENTNGVVYNSETGLYEDEIDKTSLQEAKDSVDASFGLINGVLGSVGKFLDGDFAGGLQSIFEGLFGWINDLILAPDRDKAKQQRENNKLIEKLNRSIDDLNYSMQDLAGTDVWDNMTEQMRQLEQQQALLQANLDLELAKKHGDSEQAQDMQDQIDEAEKKIKDLTRDIKTQILGTGDELSEALTNPLVDAFKQGENAARSWRDAVRNYVGDVLKEVLLTKVVAPRLQAILDDFFSLAGGTDSASIAALFNNEDEVSKLVDSLDAEGNGIISIFDALPQKLKDLIAYNSDTQTLSGGIEGITEDTARTLEGLSNSMLAQLILQTGYLQATEGNTSAQLNQLKQMVAETRVMKQMTMDIRDAIEQLRNGVRPLHVMVN